jgi:hypothetical protein
MAPSSSNHPIVAALIAWEERIGPEGGRFGTIARVNQVDQADMGYGGDAAPNAGS